MARNVMQSRQGIVISQRKGVVRWIVCGLVLLLVGVFVIPFFFVVPFAGPYGYYWSGNYPHPFFFFPFGFLIFILFFFFIARLLFYGWGRGYYRGHWRYGDALEIVRERYARGEITKEQFDQMMRDLKEHG